WKRDRTSFAYVATLFATLSVGLVFYLNFKYGYSHPIVAELGPEAAQARERDYFFIVSFSVWGLWAGIGLTALWLQLSERFGGVADGWRKASPVMAIALLPLVLNWPYASRAGQYA